jgi:hypothetical protein
MFESLSTCLSSPGDRASDDRDVMIRRDGNGDRRERKTFALRVSGLAKRTADEAIVKEMVAELYK